MLQRPLASIIAVLALPLFLATSACGDVPGQLGAAELDPDEPGADAVTAIDDSLKGGKGRNGAAATAGTACGTVPIDSLELVSPIHVRLDVDETPYRTTVANPYYPDQSTEPTTSRLNSGIEGWTLVELNADGSEGQTVLHYPKGIPFGWEWDYVLFHVHFEGLKPNQSYRAYLHSSCTEKIQGEYRAVAQPPSIRDFTTGSLVPETNPPEIVAVKRGSLSFWGMAAAVEAYDDTALGSVVFTFRGDFSAAGNTTGMQQCTRNLGTFAWPEKIVCNDTMNYLNLTTIGGNMPYCSLPAGTTSTEVEVIDVFGNRATGRM